MTVWMSISGMYVYVKLNNIMIDKYAKRTSFCF